MATTRRLADYAASSEPILKLPHPYQTPYIIVKAQDPDLFQIRQQSNSNTKSSPQPPPERLDNVSLFFSEPTDLKSSDRPHGTNNTAWGRARRSPSVTVSWEGSQPPTVGQLWLITYAVFTIRLRDEFFRLQLNGTGSEVVRKQLKAVSLAVDHPADHSSDSTSSQTEELVIVRAAFWQGAASPFGSRPVWCPLESDCLPNPSSYPLPPTDHTITCSSPPNGSSISWHPRRPVKPRPGSIIYSRYIPHLQETFSMICLDHTNKDHISIFHTWQNDPRVSQGWNQTGTLAQHKTYLEQTNSDPHKLAILAKFDETFFAYFEIYWAKEDQIGAYYSAGDYDRGRHSLVGDVRYRGPHRVSAWWSSLMHYLFLDEPRTMTVVGEPKYTNSSVLMYDLMHGFGLEKFIDLPYKRSGLMSCSREKFFQLCPFDESEKVVGGTGVGLVPKL